MSISYVDSDRLNSTELEHAMAEAIRQIVEKMTQQTSVAEVAGRLGISPVGLESLFRRHWRIASALRVAAQLKLDVLRDFRDALGVTVPLDTREYVMTDRDSNYD